MDTEGAEMLALLGMPQLVKEGPLTVITELVPDLTISSGFEPAEYVSKLVEYGFKVEIIGEEDYSISEIINTIKRRTGVTLLCFKPEKSKDKNSRR